MREGFGSSCYVKLHSYERQALYRAALRARQAGELVVGYRRTERVKARLGLLPLH